MFREDRRKNGSRSNRGNRTDRTANEKWENRRQVGWSGFREEGISQSFLRRDEYSNFTPLIRDDFLFLWGGKALLVFVSSLIICMMYSTALYSVMGERWHSGRLTMRPEGHRDRHSQLYSAQRSKAAFLYPTLVTITQWRERVSNNSGCMRSP